MIGGGECEIDRPIIVEASECDGIVELNQEEFFFFKQVSEQPQPPCTKFEVQHKTRKQNENNKYITYIFMRRFESFISILR